MTKIIANTAVVSVFFALLLRILELFGHNYTFLPLFSNCLLALDYKTLGFFQRSLRRCVSRTVISGKENGSICTRKPILATEQTFYAYVYESTFFTRQRLSAIFIRVIIFTSVRCGRPKNAFRRHLVRSRARHTYKVFQSVLIKPRFSLSALFNVHISHNT